MKALKNCMFCLKTVFKYAPVNAIICFAGFLVPGFFTGLNVLLVQNIVDSAVAYAKGTGELNTLILYGVLLVVMTTLWAALQRIAVYQRDVISVKLTKNLAPAIADRLMSLEFAAFEEQATHETLQKMTKEPEQKILDCFFRVMVVGTTTISLIFTMAVFFSISPWIGAGVIVIGIPMAVLGYYSAGRQVVITEEAADARRRIADLKGMLTNKHAMFEMKLFGADELFMDKWTYYGDKQEKLTMRENKKILIMNISSNLLSLVYIMFVVCMVAAGLLSGGLTLGQFTAALSGAAGVQDKLTGAVYNVSILIRLSMDMSFYMKFMDMEVRADIGEKSELKYYDIAFENVSFRYPGTDREILKNVTFYVKEGERIAFVGENGAGKTTIIKLLCGLYEPTTGNVTIGGVPVRELSEELRLKLLSVVFQDFGSF